MFLICVGFLILRFVFSFKKKLDHIFAVAVQMLQSKYQITADNLVTKSIENGGECAQTGAFEIRERQENEMVANKVADYRD